MLRLGRLLRAARPLRRKHGGKIGQISVYGQEANPTTWRLASMNRAIRGIDFDFGKEPASNLGYIKDRVLRDFKPKDIEEVAHTLHAGKRGEAVGEPGYAKAAVLADIRKHEYVLTPGRSVRAAAVEGDREAFEDKMARLTATLSRQFAERARLEAGIRKNLAGPGYAL